MKTITEYFAMGAIGILLFILAAALSWVFVVLIIWLLSLCFGFDFSLLIATGIWLVWLLLRSIFEPISKGE